MGAINESNCLNIRTFFLSVHIDTRIAPPLLFTNQRAKRVLHLVRIFSLLVVLFVRLLVKPSATVVSP